SYTTARDVSLDLSSLGSLTIKDTHATGVGGGIAGIVPSGHTASITLGDNLVFTGNSAASYGGAVYAYGDITLGTGALFRANSARYDSALFGRNIAVSGHSFFVGNSADLGGAIEATASGSVTLNADTGPIAFSGNTNSVDYRSIELGSESHLFLDGSYNIYLDDPVRISGGGEGSSLTKNGTGMVQFVGSSLLGTTSQQNGEVTINDGIVRLAEGARLQAGGSDGKQFTVESAATLAGNGSFSINNGFVVRGALSPDSDRFETPTFNETTLRFLEGRTDVADDKRIGILNFDGDLHLDGATLKIDLDPLAMQKNDVVEVRESGRLTFGSDASAVDVDRWAEGRFEFLKTAGGITGDNIAVGTVNGMSIGDRQTTRLEVTANSIFLVNTTDANLDLVWTGTTNDQWDTATANNWHSPLAGGAAKFNPDDYVIFDTTGTTREVVIPDGATAQVAGMRVDGTYVFSGGGITSPSATADHGQTITNTLAIVSGSAVFNNSVDFANGMTVAAGSTAILQGGGSWNDMDIANDGMVTIHRAAGLRYAHGGVLSGTGSLQISGEGLVELSADSSAFTGPTTVYGGVLALSGMLGGGVDVRSGASLTGWGEAKGLTRIASGGTLNPWNMSDDDSGTAGGILRLGSLTMDAGSTFAVSALDGLVRVDGVAAIDPGISFRFDSSFAKNETKTILNAGTLDWPVNGVSGSTAFLEYVATRAATSDSRWDLNLDLKILRTLADAAQSRNQRAVAGALGDWSDYYWSLMSSATDEEARYGLDMASGEAHANLATRLVSYSRDFWKFRRGGVRQARAVVASSDTANALLIHPGVDFGSRPLLWFEVGHNYSRSTSDSETARATLSGPSFAVGGETPVGASWLAGLAFRYGDHDFKVDSRNSKSDTDNYELGLYAVRAFGCGPVLPRLTIGARGGYHSIDSRRIVPGFDLGDQRLTADYHAWSFSGYAELAAKYAVSESLVLEPHLNLDWTSVWNNGFSERGGDLALRVGRGHQGNFSSLMGVRLRARVKERLGFDADLGWRHTYGPVRPEASMLFVASPTRDSFTVIGSKLARDEAVVAAGVTYDITDRVGVRLGYDGTFGRKSLSHAVTATVGVGF
ncbi:MAG: autotransporter domain-containing protein, partial [Planctomycetes bacterium]|nr:autotransporter domain-containing protein [Planctomycetota bacterium]